MGLARGYCRRGPWRDGLEPPKEQALLSDLSGTSWSEIMKLEGFLSKNVSTVFIKVQRIPVLILRIQNTADWK